MGSKLSFTVFLPVKNGGDYLSICVESILNQTYSNFELIILENQSNDGTADYLANLASKNARVKVLSTDKPLSIESNWARVLQQKKNDYMTIIGHDDVLEPDFLAEIKKIIDENPEASLYQTHFKLIDANGELIRQCLPIPKFETAAEFLAARLNDMRDSFGTGYVVRSELYDKVGGIPAYPNLLFSDDALWLKSIGSGFKVASSKVCFLYRLHSASTSGKPNQRALFYGLKRYLGFLKTLATENIDIANAIKPDIKSYVMKRCQEYYFHVLKHNLLWQKPVDNEVIEINKMMVVLTSLGVEGDVSAFTKKPRFLFFIATIIKKIFRRITRTLIKTN